MVKSIPPRSFLSEVRWLGQTYTKSLDCTLKAISSFSSSGRKRVILRP